MPLPPPLETATVTGTWESPITGTPLAGTATLLPLNAAVSPAADVLLTESPGKVTLVNGVATWTGVLLTDSAGLSNQVAYRLIVKGNGHFEDRIVELLKAMVVGGTIKLSTTATATPGPALATYLLAASVGAAGGVPGPLDASRQIPAGQIPAGGSTPDATTTSKGIVQLAGDLAGTAAAPTVPGLAGKQPLDADLTAIAALAPADGSLIQRVAGAWASQTAAQVKTSLGISYTDIAGTVPTSALPAIAITEYLGAVGSQAAMLLLVGQQGDWCTRTDLGTNWVITGTDPTQLASWTQLTYPAAPVTSVNGQAGVVVLAKGDIGLGNVNNTADSAKPVSTAQQSALDGKVANSLLDAAGDLYVATADNTPARLPVGTDGQILVVDTTQATRMRWATRTHPAYTPASDGLVAVGADPLSFRSGSPLGAAGWAVRITIPAGMPITGVGCTVSTAGVLGGGGTNGFGINSITGPLVSSTVDDNNLWTATGPREKLLPAQIPLQSNEYDIYASLRQSGYATGANFEFIDGTSNGGRLDGLRSGHRRSLVLTGSVWGAVDPAAGPSGGGYMPFIYVF